MVNQSDLMTIPLPRSWPGRVKSATLHVISLAQFAPDDVRFAARDLEMRDPVARAEPHAHLVGTAPCGYGISGLAKKNQDGGVKMMKMVRSLLWMLVAVMMIAVAPSFAGEATQMWRCELDDDATEEQVMEGAQKWLAAAKTMKGGKNLEAYVYHPVVVNATNQVDLLIVLVAPTFKEWGEFWDGYPDSPAAAVEEETNKVFICPDSVLWQAYKVE